MLMEVCNDWGGVVDSKREGKRIYANRSGKDWNWVRDTMRGS